MKIKSSIIFVFFLILNVTCAFAQFSDQKKQEGFTGPKSQPLNTVSAAQSAKDDSWVILRGNIMSQIADEEYIFADSTGEITVEIDDKLFKGITVSPEDLVEISGEVDRNFRKSEIDVKRLIKIEK